MVGYSRDSFYRFKEFYDKAANWPCSRKKPVLKSPVLQAIEDMPSQRWRSSSQPSVKVRVTNELRQHAFTVPPRDAQSLWNITAGCLTRA
jgi:hypothetical protein